MHDPTISHAKAHDREIQYRSVIFFYSPDQLKGRKTASRPSLEISGRLMCNNVTEIEPASTF
ncbi:MAG: methionine sulfoxide reductase A [Methanosaeta sp. PtaB.Bin039]|nr:MAG: methionine sulfoxide reductase A [Methanosaeta sp. PtaB.Bin039]HOT08029.1 peptide-methionine (S)-S-oxide reductase [Methanotrichaceae archaeon]HQF15582.1 peptide-methionine (S)-S-oxide reductase [Methanotrichaceae archaeon]HQI90318.1 peptide-methionine (S)-S-oxide reductase [Methanotrichaceae archaeon]HQJ28561.1 peptide-methionine (S)-S-oxide reductase [Methanotrichaceae archaeon]